MLVNASTLLTPNSYSFWHPSFLLSDLCIRSTNDVTCTSSTIPFSRSSEVFPPICNLPAANFVQ